MLKTSMIRSRGWLTHHCWYRQKVFRTVLTGICTGCLIVSIGCDRQADATRTTSSAVKTTGLASPTASIGSEPAATTPVTTVVPETAVPEKASPIRIEPPALDFGAIQKGSTAEATVRLINTSDEPVRVLKARTSCGCTVAELTTEPFGPGESIEITVRLKPSGKVGTTSTKTVRLILDGDFAPIPLLVTGQVVERVTKGQAQLERSPATELKRAVRSLDRRVLGVLATIHLIVDLMRL